MTHDTNEHRISVDGVIYHVTLDAERYSALITTLMPYVRNAHAIRRRGGRGPARGTLPPSAVTALIRHWWRAHPDGLPEWKPWGKIPQSVHDAWNNKGARSSGQLACILTDADNT